jgi:hypothetical protein
MPRATSIHRWLLVATFVLSHAYLPMAQEK